MLGREGRNVCDAGLGPLSGGVCGVDNANGSMRDWVTVAYLPEWPREYCLLKLQKVREKLSVKTTLKSER